MALQTSIASAPVQASTAPLSRFLSRLPPETYQRIVSQSTRVALGKEEHLCETGMPLTWSYLPCSGLVSLQTSTVEGGSVEVAMIGSEGMVGVPAPSGSAAAPQTAVVVLPGDALRLRSDILQRELERDAALQRALIAYSYTLIAEIAQGSVCHRFHTAKQRLARWLLAACDRTQSQRILMTQERLGQALGLQRTGVTPASVALQDAGAIKSRHGRIIITDRRRLEMIACECYQAGRERAQY